MADGFSAKTSGRRVFWLCPALARSLQPALGMLVSVRKHPRRLGQNQNPLPQHPLQFSDRLLAFRAKTATLGFSRIFQYFKEQALMVQPTPSKSV